MTAQPRTNHKWDSPIEDGDEIHWICRLCHLVVVTPGSARHPTSALPGRTVNGAVVGRHYPLPSCSVVAPKPPPDKSCSAAPRLPPDGRTAPARASRMDDPFSARDHELRTCYEALGKSWVEAAIGPRKFDAEGDLDLDWEMALLQLYSAVYVLNMDAVDLIDVVRDRVRERTRRTIVERGLHYGSPATERPARGRGRIAG